MQHNRALEQLQNAKRAQGVSEEIVIFSILDALRESRCCDVTTVELSAVSYTGRVGASRRFDKTYKLLGNREGGCNKNQDFKQFLLFWCPLIHKSPPTSCLQKKKHSVWQRKKVPVLVLWYTFWGANKQIFDPADRWCSPHLVIGVRDQTETAFASGGMKQTRAPGRFTERHTCARCVPEDIFVNLHTLREKRCISML